MKKSFLLTRIVLASLVFACAAEPIVMTAAMLPFLLSRPIDGIRCVDHRGNAVPFQIDEVLPDEEYVCSGGKEPNAGNGVLDSIDEIVFLWEDADTCDSLPTNNTVVQADTPVASAIPYNRVAIGHATQRRYVYFIDDPSLPLSATRYLDYNETTHTVTSPSYKAAFCPDKFHFIKAGVKDDSSNTFFEITNELRIKICFRALWGLIPINYSENSLVCPVKRFKAGPIRLIRRGDFHLKLGLWLKSSRAAVNQLCYPDMVRVPVYVHLPMHFRSLFSQAYIEMTPVIRKGTERFSFKVPQHDIAFHFDNERTIDSIMPVNPNRGFMTVENGAIGYGWLLDATMQETYLEGSGYVFRKPTPREGLCHCGFRLSVRDLPKGYYSITNWVVFSNSGTAAFALDDAADCLTNKAAIAVGPFSADYVNQLTKVKKYKKR